MARDFSKDTSNYMTLPTATINGLISGASKVVVHAWIYPDTYSSGQNENAILYGIINGTGTGGVQFNVNGLGSVLRCRGRSQSGDSAQNRDGTTSLTTGQWWSIGGVWDFGGDTITPYVNGVAEGGGSVTFGATTYTPGTPSNPDNVGFATGSIPPGSTATMIDGRMAELAIWALGASDSFGADQFGALAKGVSARMVHPSGLVFYMPLTGNASPEPDYFGGVAGTIVGSVPKADHPRLIYPDRPRLIIPATVAAGAIPRLVNGGLVGSSLIGGGLVR